MKPGARGQRRPRWMAWGPQGHAGRCVGPTEAPSPTHGALPAPPVPPFRGASPQKGLSACTCWAGPGTGAGCSDLGPVRAALSLGSEASAWAWTLGGGLGHGLQASLCFGGCSGRRAMAPTPGAWVDSRMVGTLARPRPLCQRDRCHSGTCLKVGWGWDCDWQVPVVPGPF